jgi:hypothetical protein
VSEIGDGAKKGLLRSAEFAEAVLVQGPGFAAVKEGAAHDHVDECAALVHWHTRVTRYQSRM